MTTKLRPTYESSPQFETFRSWTREEEVPGICLDQEKLLDARFIPKSKVEKYLTIPSIVSLIEAVYNGTRTTAIRPIRSHCLRVFCILLSCGYGHYIHHFTQQQSLHDENLPFTEAVILEHLPRDADLAAEFFQAQWKWCAQDFADWKLIDVALRPSVVLPITQYRRIGEGRTAQIYQIMIHDEYNTFRVRIVLAPCRIC
jgi:hypothetical protein